MNPSLIGLARPYSSWRASLGLRTCINRKLSRISVPPNLAAKNHPAVKWPSASKAPVSSFAHYFTSQRHPRLLLDPRMTARRPFFTQNQRLYSTQPSEALPTSGLPTLTHPAVAYYLYAMAALIFAIVVIGGLTRLTESGLSITEWNLVTGVLPPLSEEAWQAELAKYAATPEGKLLNKNITLEDFKFIYSMEWSHRLLGRVLGVAFLLPIPFFAYKRYLSPQTSRRLLAIALLIGGQGALGWYMVKSGLTHEAIAEANPSGVPRVSQYRLAAHLGMAFAVYALCLREAFGILRDWNLAVRGVGLGGAKDVVSTWRGLHSPLAGRVRLLFGAFTGLVFLTALSGAFVAGLDAGLLYNTFPLMGDRLIPPTNELLDPAYARKADQSDLLPRNVFENPTTVQFDHRVLAMTTFTSAILLAIYMKRSSVQSQLPRLPVRHASEMAAMALIQATLGVSTLVHLVPTALASMHQAGSLVLLSLCVAAGASVRRPSGAVKRWLTARGVLTGLP